MRQLTKDHVLARLAAHPDTWELADVPAWLRGSASISA
jgi:hypothetical protein